MTDMRNQKQHDMWAKVARDKWYQLSMVLSESDVSIKIKEICEMTDFPNDRSLRSYFDKWGDMMVEKYGKLPYRKINSNRYEKFMEMK